MFCSGLEACNSTGLRSGHITEVCQRQYGKRSAGGFIWRYVDECPKEDDKFLPPDD